MRLLVLTSRNVLLPAHDEPVPATITADPSTGKIIAIEPHHSSPDAFADSKRYEFVDAGDLYILPGLVE